MGISRSSTIVIAYVMYHLKINVMDAINFVRQKRPIVNPNYGFVCQLYNLENIILNLDNTNYQTQNKTEEEIRQEINETYEKLSFIKEKFPKDN